MLLLLIAGAAIGAAVFVVVAKPIAKDPVTKAEIEHTVEQRTRGNVQVVLCNQIVVPTRTPQTNPPQTWTCDTYVGPTAAAAQNGPSYAVTVVDDRIQSIRRVPTH